MSVGFLDVSGLAFAAANLMQTLRTVPCTHAPDQRCGRKKAQVWGEQTVSWVQLTWTPSAGPQDQCCWGLFLFQSAFPWGTSEISDSCFLEISASAFFPLFLPTTAVHVLLQKRWLSFLKMQQELVLFSVGYLNVKLAWSGFRTSYAVSSFLQWINVIFQILMK